MHNEIKVVDRDVLSAYSHNLAIGIGILALALVMRIPGLVDPRFWQDEMISLGVAGGGFFETIVGTLRYSAHPPAYYAQLNLWMLVSKNASFIILNSVLWSVATVAALFYLGRQVIGEKAATLAALFFAIMPQSLYFAGNARMYAMICFFQVIGWWAAERYVESRDAPQGGFSRSLAVLSVSQLLIGYAHGIGLVFAACLGLFGLARLLQTAAPRKVLIKYLGTQVMVGVLLAPVLINGLMRETQHLPPENFIAVLTMLTHVLFGPNPDIIALAPVTLLIYFLVVSAFFIEPRMRIAALILVILPIGASIITTMTLKPILAERPLALALPFITLCCASALAKAHSLEIQKYFRASVVVAGFIVIASFTERSMHYITQYEKRDDFRSASIDLTREVKPGESVIIAEGPSILWGLSWYLLGAESVSPLRVQPMPNQQWQAMYARLGDGLLNWLGLKSGQEPLQDIIVWNKVPIIMHPLQVDREMSYKWIWLACYCQQGKSPISEILVKKGRKQTLVKSYLGLTISRYEAPG